MKWEFTKMQGCGNDYIYFDCMQKGFESPNKYAKLLSDRRFGIGGDGIILALPSKVADAKMRMFNSDGSEGKMCGNGIRCLGKFLRDQGYIDKDEFKIETLSGVKNLEFIEYGKDTVLKVDLGCARLDSELLKTNIKETKIVDYPIDYKQGGLKITCVSMGNPHCVIFCDDLEGVDLEGIGEYFQTSGIFKDGVNVEFVTPLSAKSIKMRVYERGSKETLACGTGACAAVVASVLNGYCEKDKEIEVELKGGILKVDYRFDKVYLCGEAKTVFKGYIEL